MSNSLEKLRKANAASANRLKEIEPSGGGMDSVEEKTAKDKTNKVKEEIKEEKAESLTKKEQPELESIDISFNRNEVPNKKTQYQNLTIVLPTRHMNFIKIMAKMQKTTIKQYVNALIDEKRLSDKEYQEKKDQPFMLSEEALNSNLFRTMRRQEEDYVRYPFSISEENHDYIDYKIFLTSDTFTIYLNKLFEEEYQKYVKK